MSTPIEQIAALTIGTVESVSPSEIKVLLELNAPQATALNTGVPTGFPRINGYVLIPNETGAVVGLVVWLGVERSDFPKRPGLKDFWLVDLPFPLRKLAVTPLGTLISRKNSKTGRSSYHLERGVGAFPSVGDPVLLPTAEQLKSIIESSDEADLRVQIGSSPLAANARVSVDPNKLFGRHFAVLGNTGSGKSCSVAGLIRWSLESALSEQQRLNKQDQVGKRPNARFIILDPNGEYLDAFKDFAPRVFRASLREEDEAKPLKVPVWMWNVNEWASFGRAAPGIQRPLLGRALREMKSGGEIKEPSEVQTRRTFSAYLISSRFILRKGAESYSDFPGNKNFGLKLRRMAEDAEQHIATTQDNLKDSLESLRDELFTIANSRFAPYNRGGQQIENYDPFSEGDVRRVVAALEKVVASTGTTSIPTGDEDAPVPFDGNALADHLEHLAQEAGESQRMDSLLLRIRMLLADGRLGPVVNSQDGTSLEQWLEDYIGANDANNGNITILDLSLVPSDVLHTIIAVVARAVFEATLRYRRLSPKGEELPTVLVLEEAHTFVRRGSDEEEGTLSSAQMCRQTFERIAREGRKFGLGLVLSSQRPSELSPTVLAQCNTFLLHRIVNDRDQELVGRLVPDNLSGLLKELPSLPSQQGILLGWAVSVPVLVEIKGLPVEHQPRSSDPRYWEVWTRREERRIDWRKIVADWTGREERQEQDSSADPGALAT